MSLENIFSINILNQMKRGKKVTLSSSNLSITKTSTSKTIEVFFKDSGVNSKINQNSIPKFNHDNLYYTPAFVNDEDSISSQFDQKVSKYLHCDRVAQ